MKKYICLKKTNSSASAPPVSRRRKNAFELYYRSDSFFVVHISQTLTHLFGLSIHVFSGKEQGNALLLFSIILPWIPRILHRPHSDSDFSFPGGITFTGDGSQGISGPGQRMSGSW